MFQWMKNKSKQVKTFAGVLLREVLSPLREEVQETIRAEVRSLARMIWLELRRGPGEPPPTPKWMPSRVPIGSDLPEEVLRFDPVDRYGGRAVPLSADFRYSAMPPFKRGLRDLEVGTTVGFTSTGRVDLDDDPNDPLVKAFRIDQRMRQAAEKAN